LTTQFTYNGDGHRLRKVADGVTTTYVIAILGLPQVLVEITGGNSTAYLHGHDLLAEEDTAWTWHLNDGLGSVRQLTGGNGDVTLTQGYTPFGLLLWQEGDTATTYGFTGEQQDPAVGLVFLRARYYDPATGRFINMDSYPGETTSPASLHPYLYTDNNPLKYVDPTGNDPDWYDLLLGMTRQFVDDMLLGAPTLVFGDTWQYIQDKEYQQGREIGHCASIVVGSALVLHGAANIGTGLGAMLPTTGVGVACTAATGGLCAVLTGVGLSAEAALVGVGIAETGWGLGVINYAKKHPVNGGEGDHRVTTRPLRGKAAAKKAKELGYTKRVPPQKLPFNSRNQPGFYNPKTKKYITPDVGHSRHDPHPRGPLC
jgi:RHS repeat-associated protein